MNEFICVKCDKSFASNRTLKNHLNKKFPCVKTIVKASVDCKYCYKKLSSKFSKERHEEKCKYKNDLSEEDRKFCNKVETIMIPIFKMLDLLPSEDNNITKNNKLLNTISNKISQNKDVDKCKLLQYTINTHYNIKKVDEFECPKCEKVFSRKFNMERHHKSCKK
jgi:Fe2+ transport system protein B